MGLFSKKQDPISERARELNSRIAALESEIKKLSAHTDQNTATPRLRSTARPQSATPAAPPPAALPPEPIFEEVDQDRLQSRAEPESTPGHFNDLGVRKYDLPALMRRIKNHLRGPTTTNPKLVSYLAAGSIQGLRPMRYEKRVARNRFIVMVVVLFLLLLGIISLFYRNR